MSAFRVDRTAGQMDLPMEAFVYKNGELFCENTPIAKLAAQFGTPLWVYSRAKPLHEYRAIRDAFAALDPVICYSVKSNSNLGLLKLLNEAGWQIKPGSTALTNAKGEPMTIEFLIPSETFTRHCAQYIANLQKLGIQASVRVVDPAQYERRETTFDFDAIVDGFPQSMSPGNEQRDFWGSAAADTPGSRNTIGIKDPVVDAMIDAIIRAESREALETACRALDRVLLWGFYLVPQFTDNGYRMAWWDKFGQPAKLPTEAPDLFSWWVDTARDEATGAGKQQIDTKPAL